MADTDEEQLETLKRWWNENGTSLIIGVVLALGGTLGYQAWQNHRQETGEAAASIYNDLMDALTVEGPFATLDDETLQTGEFLAGQLKDEYSGSSYAHLASLFLAKIAVERGDLAQAETELAWALDHGLEASLRPIAAMRLARVRNAMGDHEEALKTLVGIEPGEHRPTYEEIRGDIYLAMGDTVQARESYQAGLNALENPSSRPMLQMKLDDLEAPTLTLPVGEDDPLKAAGPDANQADQS